MTVIKAASQQSKEKGENSAWEAVLKQSDDCVGIAILWKLLIDKIKLKCLKELRQTSEGCEG